MDINTLQVMLDLLKERGLPGTTPVVIAIGDEDEDTVELVEVEETRVLDNVMYQIDSEKMAAIHRQATVAVLSTSMSPNYENTSAGQYYLKGK